MLCIATGGKACALAPAYYGIVAVLQVYLLVYMDHDTIALYATKAIDDLYIIAQVGQCGSYGIGGIGLL